MSRIRLTAVFFAPLFMLACGGDAPLEDGLCTASPCPPRLTDWECPPSWRTHPTFVDSNGVEDTPPALASVKRCEPPSRGTCSPGMAQFLGESACQPIGTSCPTSAFPTAETLRALAPGFPGTIRYADMNAAAGGNGSENSPFNSMASAFAATRAGDIVALSTGTFRESLRFNRAVAVVGACVEQTIVEAPTQQEGTGTFDLPGLSGVRRIANLTVSGPRPAIWLWGNSERLDVSSVEIRDAQGYGLVYEARVDSTVQDLVVTGTESRLSSGLGGEGLFISAGAQVTASRVIIENNRGGGVAILDGNTFADLSDFVIRDTRGYMMRNENGTGISVVLGAKAALHRMVIERNRGVGLQVYDGGSRVDANDIAILDTLEAANNDRFGRGIELAFGATLIADRVLIDSPRDGGILATQPRTIMAIRDLQVQRTLGELASGDYGHGITVRDGAFGSLTRTVIDATRSSGISVTGSGTEVVAADLVIRRTESDTTRRDYGRGIDADDGAHVKVERAFFDSNRSETVVALFANTVVDLADVVIRGTRQAACGAIAEGQPGSCTVNGINKSSGSAIAAAKSGRINLTGFEISGSALSGILVGEGSVVNASNGKVFDNTIGLSISDPSFDWSNIAASVEVFNNGLDLDASVLPLPESLDDIDVR